MLKRKRYFTEMENDVLHEAVRENNLKKVNAIIDAFRGEEGFINQTNANDYTALYVACNEEKTDINIIKSLLYHGADPNIGDLYGETPFMLVCRNFDVKLLKFFIEHGADIRARGRVNRTILHYAIRNKTPENLKYLLSLGVDPNIPGSCGNVPLALAILLGVKYGNILVPVTDLKYIRSLKYNIFDIILSTNNFFTLQALLEFGYQIPNELLLKDTVVYKAFTIRAQSMFEILWKFTDKDWFCSKYIFPFINQLIIYAKSHGNFTYLNAVLDTQEFLNIDVNPSGLFSQIFEEPVKDLQIILNHNYFLNSRAHIDYNNKLHYIRNKENYIRLMHFIKNKKIILKTNDLKMFFSFFKFCAYKIELLKILLQFKGTIVNIYALQKVLQLANDPYFNVKEIIIELLGNCVEIKVDLLYMIKSIFQENNDLDTFFLERFIPEKKDDSPPKFEVPENAPKCKSLCEIARDEYRNHLLNITKSHQEFLEILDTLPLPEIIRGILKFKYPATRIE